MIVGQTATRVIDCVDNLSLQRNFAMERFTRARWSARAGCGGTLSAKGAPPPWPPTDDGCDLCEDRCIVLNRGDSAGKYARSLRPYSHQGARQPKHQC